MRCGNGGVCSKLVKQLFNCESLVMISYCKICNQRMVAHP